MHFKDWLPLIAIVGPILAAFITALVTRHFRERKRINFNVDGVDDLMLSLRQHFPVVVLRLGNQDVRSLNRAVVYVSNTGNVPLKDVSFDVVIPGEHSTKLLSEQAKDHKLRRDI